MNRPLNSKNGWVRESQKDSFKRVSLCRNRSQLLAWHAGCQVPTASTHSGIWSSRDRPLGGRYRKHASPANSTLIQKRARSVSRTQSWAGLFQNAQWIKKSARLHRKSSRSTTSRTIFFWRWRRWRAGMPVWIHLPCPLIVGLESMSAIPVEARRSVTLSTPPASMRHLISCARWRLLERCLEAMSNAWLPR